MGFSITRSDGNGHHIPLEAFVVADPRIAAGRQHIDEAVLEGAGHWWALEQPAQAAAALRTFWAKTPLSP